MTGAIRPVHPALRECLAGPLVAYDLALPAEAVHLGAPSTGATVVIAIDSPLDVGWLDEPEASAQQWCSITGLHLRPALIRTHGLQRGIHVSVTPVGCRALFGTPIGALFGCTVDLAELPGGFRPRGHGRIARTRGWAERLAVVEALLLDRWRSRRPPDDLVEGWRRLTGGGRVTDVAAELGWSRRHWTNRVRAEFGLPPKAIGRLARFERAHRAVRAGVPLATAAHAAGYADQSHLSREWKRFAGRSPSASDEDFPNFQEILPAPVDSGGHDDAADLPLPPL